MKNKLKDEMEKIKMSDKTKESIIAACEEAARNKAINRNDNEYIDHVYGVEKVKPRNRIMRSISAVAACALIAGGIGTTGVLLHKQGAAPSAEVETTTVATKNVTAISPFGDFSTFEFSVDSGDGVKNKYDDETQEKLADFLNNFSWGEEFPDTNIPDSYAKDSMDKFYRFSWRTDDKVHTLMVIDSGVAAYNVSRLVEENGVGSVGEETRAFRIDFAAFDRGMKEILKDELEADNITFVEESPFTDILSGTVLVDSFNIGFGEVEQEQRLATIKLFNSLKWTECDCADKFADCSFLNPNRDYFSVVNLNDGLNTYIMLTADGYACTFTEKIIGEGDLEYSDKKCYTCNDPDIGEKLLDIFDPVESDNVQTGEQDMTDHDMIVDLFNSDHLGCLVVWCDENGGWRKQDFDQDQYETVKKYFDEHEVKEIVPNTFGRIEMKRWNDEFGFSQIQLYDTEKEEHMILYISRDSSLIAIKRPNDDPDGENLRIYKAEGLDALQFIRDFAE